MSLSDAIRTSIANQINAATERTRSYYPELPATVVHPNDVDTVDFVWDEGETSDNEDYGLSLRLPSMEIRVTTKPLPSVSPGIGRRPTPGRPKQWHTVGAGPVLNELFQTILREGL